MLSGLVLPPVQVLNACILRRRHKDTAKAATAAAAAAAAAAEAMVPLPALPGTGGQAGLREADPAPLPPITLSASRSAAQAAADAAAVTGSVRSGSGASSFHSASEDEESFVGASSWERQPRGALGVLQPGDFKRIPTPLYAPRAFGLSLGMLVGQCVAHHACSMQPLTHGRGMHTRVGCCACAAELSQCTVASRGSGIACNVRAHTFKSWLAHVYFCTGGW